MNQIKNAVVFITGGASGIGKAVAERIINLGGRACIADKDPNGCNIAKMMGERAMFCLTDVTQECDVIDSLNQTKECFGKIDVLVNGAGIFRREPFYDFVSDTPHSEDTFKNILETNVWGTFNTSRLAAGIMSKNKPNECHERGVIINIGSVLSYESISFSVAYATSKSAVIGMTLPLARGLASKGIRVVTVCPGLIDTPMKNYFTKNFDKKWIPIQMSPKRFGTSEEVAHLIQTIIENPFINNEVIRIDAGARVGNDKEIEWMQPDKC